MKAKYTIPSTGLAGGALPAQRAALLRLWARQAGELQAIELLSCLDAFLHMPGHPPAEQEAAAEAVVDGFLTPLKSLFADLPAAQRATLETTLRERLKSGAADALTRYVEKEKRR